jgi:hypothetical protein
MAEMASPIEGGIQAAREVGGGDAALYQRVQATESSIISLSSSLNGISQQMSQFSLSLQSISANITAETNLERQKDRQEQQQEFLLAQQQIREGKESAIERKIQASLSAPVQKISAKAENTLGRLKQVLTGVLFGWLAVSTVGLIKKYSVDVPNKLTSVRDTILKGLNTAGQFLSGIKSSLTNVFSTISAISTRVAQHVNGRWFMEPIQNLVDAVKNSFKTFFNIGKGADKKDGTGGSPPAPTSTNGIGGSPDNMTPTGGEAPTTGEQTTNTSGMSGLSNLLMSQSALSNLGMLPEQTGAEGKTSQPTTPMVNPLQINQEPVSGAKEVHSEQQESAPAMYGEFSISPLQDVTGLDTSSTPVGTQQSPTTIAQIAPVAQKDVSQKVGALPEPKANVIVASAPAQQQTQPGYSQGKAPASDIPAIPSSNPNNFYAMYSKSVYNVIG